MKRERRNHIAIVFMVIALALTLAACGSDPAEPTEEAAETTQTTEAPPLTGENLGDFAASLCWPYGEMSKGRYDGGEKTPEYAALYDRIRPQDESDIKSTQWNAGASCDLFVATALRGFGIMDFPVTLSRQCNYFFLSDQYKEYFDAVETDGSAADMQHGDVCIYIRSGSENNGQGHIFIVNKSEGQNWRSNAHYRKDNGYYGVTDDFDDYDPDKYKYFGVFRLKDRDAAQ